MITQSIVYGVRVHKEREMIGNLWRCVCSTVQSLFSSIFGFLLSFYLITLFSENTSSAEIPQILSENQHKYSEFEKIKTLFDSKQNNSEYGVVRNAKAMEGSRVNPYTATNNQVVNIESHYPSTIHFSLKGTWVFFLQLFSMLQVCGKFWRRFTFHISEIRMIKRWKNIIHQFTYYILRWWRSENKNSVINLLLLIVKF